MASPISDEASTRKLFFGWRVASAALVLGIFGFGVGHYGTGLYLRTIVDTRGWSVSLVSAAVTLHYLVAAATMLLLPFLYRTMEVARVTKLGAILLAFGVLAWAAASRPWYLFAAALVSGAGWAATSGVALNAIVAPWFDRQRPAALSLAYNGGSIGGLVFPSIWVVAIGSFGFVWAAIVIGTVLTITIWVLADLYFAKSPSSMGLFPDDEGSSASGPQTGATGATARPGRLLWRSRQFISLAAGMSLGFFVQFGMIAHLFSLLVPALGAQTAGMVLGAIGLAAILGRIWVTRLLTPGRDRRIVAVINLSVQLAGTVAFLLADGETVALLAMGVVLLGFGIGNGASLPPLIAQVDFTRHDASRAIPVIIAIAQATSAFAPMVFGLIRDLAPGCASSDCGSAPILFATAGVLQIAACACFLAGRK